MILESSKDIKIRLRSVWPDLKFIWPTNRSWLLVSDEWMVNIIRACSVKHMTYIKGIWECENYADRFKSNAEEYLYNLYEAKRFNPKYRWAIGEAIGMKSDMFGNPFVHGMNVILTEKRVVIFEPQEDVFLENTYEYIPFFIKF